MRDETLYSTTIRVYKQTNLHYNFSFYLNDISFELLLDINKLRYFTDLFVDSFRIKNN